MLSLLRRDSGDDILAHLQLNYQLDSFPSFPN